MIRTEPKTLRCAIYTRVSTEHGLEQEFNSLDNQREAAEAYVKSQAHEGWRCLRDRYDDGGFSGGSMERPALQRLLAEIRARRIDVVVVYKVDRLTRSLADFAKLVELFDAEGISFVSVTQAFNTTTSMGRLTLNVLLSFAQFEREVTGERIRDKIAASKRKGMWMGGVVPLGYRVDGRALHVVEEHAGLIRSLYARYLALGSVTDLKAELDRSGTTVPARIDGAGRSCGGKPFSRGHLHKLLSNPIYAGQISHKGRVHAGQHLPVVDPAIWDAVQARLSAHARKHRHRIASDHLLTGRIRDESGQPMRPTHTRKGTRRYRYYVGATAAQDRKAGSIQRAAAHEIEAAVIEQLRSTASAKSLDDAALIQSELRSVCVRPGMLEIERAGGELTQLPWSPNSGQRRRKIVVPEGHAAEQRRPARSLDRDRILQSIGRARAWLQELTNGSSADPAAIAAREESSERSVRTTLSLAFLSPVVVTAIVQGRLPRGIGVTRLAELPPSWSEQHQALGI